jgi:hypothetical protein
MGRMVQQFRQPAVEAGIRYFVTPWSGCSAFATVEGLARKPGFHVLQRHGK